MNKKVLLTLIISAVLGLSACGKQGPAENLGEKIDEKAAQVEESLDNKGPMEQVGEKVDAAVENVGEKVDEAVENAGEKVDEAVAQ